MASQVEIYNMALGHIGARDTVAGIDEASRPAKICTRFYVTARDAVLEAFDWSFARKYATLAETGTPPPTWIFQYAYPNECAAIRSVLPVLGRNSKPIPFEIAHSDIGEAKVILTDQEAAVVRYTKLEDNTALFSAQFTEALAARLAAFIAKPITGKDAALDTAMSLYNMLISEAKANVMNERQQDDTQDAEWISYRE
jgi:hypothetical protein